MSTSAAAAGAVATSWSMMCSAGRGAAGSMAAAIRPVRVEPGSGAVSTVTVTHGSADWKFTRANLNDLCCRMEARRAGAPPIAA